MKYVLESISTVQACDALLAAAKKKKQYLERRVRNLGELLVTFRKRLNEVHVESAEVQSLLEVFTGAYGSLSEDKDKVNLKIRIKRLELQQAMLEKKATTYNVGALLVKEMQYNRLDSQVAALEEHIAAVAQRRAALDTPALRVIEVPTLAITQSTVLLPQPVARPALIASVLRQPASRGGQWNHFRTRIFGRIAPAA